MEQPIQVKCHLCGGAAKYAFAYARFSDRETFFGVIYRGVCRECLNRYIENIKHDQHHHGERLLWPVVLLPFGALLAALSAHLVSRVIGYFLIFFAIILPVLMRDWQRREARRARLASEAENISRYSEIMCREDALQTSRQTKLIYLDPAYASKPYDTPRIARELLVTQECAAHIRELSAEALKRMPRGSIGETDVFDNADAL